MTTPPGNRMRPEMGVFLEAGTPQHIVPDVVVARYQRQRSASSRHQRLVLRTFTAPRTAVTPRMTCGFGPIRYAIRLLKFVIPYVTTN